MTTTENTKINDYLQTQAHPLIAREERGNTCGVWLTTAAFALIVIGFTPLVSDPYISMALIVAGVMMLLVGSALIWTAKGCFRYRYRYIPTGEVIKRRNVYVDDGTARALIEGGLARLRGARPVFQSAFCLETYGTVRGEFYLVQLLHYEMYDFVPVTGVMSAAGSDADLLRRFLKHRI